MLTDEIALRVESVSKTFGPNRVLDQVSLDVRRGEVHALVGQNGSGKSTFIKILTGFHQPDQNSRAQLGQREVVLGEMTEEEQSCIHVVHQDLALVPSLTAVENLELTEVGGLRPLRLRKERARARELLHGFGAFFDIDLPVEQLRPFERASIAIARAMSHVEGMDLLILDEPTAAIGSTEAARLFDLLRVLKERGIGIIYVSHILEEILQIADRVSVLRDGGLVGTRDIDDVTERDIITMMLGEDVVAPHRVPRTTGGDVVRLALRHVSAKFVSGVSFEAHRGEVIGLAGLVGAGCEDVLATIFGANPLEEGSMILDGVEVCLRHPADAIAHGIAMMPADRTRLGLLVEQSLAENITLPLLSNVFSGGLIRGKREDADAGQWLVEMQVNTTDPSRLVRELSGGNQQKVMLAKWLRVGPRVLLLHEPTQAVDVGAKAAIERFILERASNGTLVLIASTESEDLARLCDRVIVMRSGSAVIELKGPDLTQHRLLEEINRTSGLCQQGS